MAKGKIVAKKAITKRKKDHLYFLDADGNVREVKRNTKGGKPGRKVCKKAKPKAKSTKRKATSKRKSKKTISKKLKDFFF